MDALRIGDRLRLWEAGNAIVFERGGRCFNGILLDFLAAPSSACRAIFRMDASMKVGDVTGRLLLLELAHPGACWGPVGIVHARLCSARPESAHVELALRGVPVPGNLAYEVVNRRPFFRAAAHVRQIWLGLETRLATSPR